MYSGYHRSISRFCGEGTKISAVISKDLVALAVFFEKPSNIVNYLIHAGSDTNKPLWFTVKVSKDGQKGAIDAGINGPDLT